MLTVDATCVRTQYALLASNHWRQLHDPYLRQILLLLLILAVSQGLLALLQRVGVEHATVEGVLFAVLRADELLGVRLDPGHDVEPRPELDGVLVLSGGVGERGETGPWGEVVYQPGCVPEFCPKKREIEKLDIDRCTLFYCCSVSIRTIVLVSVWVVRADDGAGFDLVAAGHALLRLADLQLDGGEEEPPSYRHWLLHLNQGKLAIR